MRKHNQRKNVFCLEGIWDNNLKSQSTVEPVLQLLEKQGLVKYIHKDCATVTEFVFYLKRWGLRIYQDFPILYLAFHGDEDGIQLEDGTMTLEEISEPLRGICKQRIVIIGSCGTLNIDIRRIKKFLKVTHALAVCGYKEDIDWIKSSAFELILIDALQDNEFSLRGIESIVEKLKILSAKFKELNFRIVTQKEIKQENKD